MTVKGKFITPNAKLPLQNLFQEFKASFLNLFDLRHDTDETGTVETITKNIDFRSGNAWMLVFAIFIASIGLNTNSTAVIIGAMLISPLMGPIVGAGLALGINDFELLKKSLKNLLAAVIIGLVTSSIYFLLSPMEEIQSELLARTRPTVYDVLIAIFGGATGIVAASRKERGNAIPGVAIATALMPPLCTAGFGLAFGNLRFFLGAFYLFIINCVFICFATFVAVRYLKFQKTNYLEKGKQIKIIRITYGVALAVFLPSVFLAYTIIQEATFRSQAKNFLQKVEIPNAHIIEREFQFDLKKPVIKITVIGDRIPKEKSRELRNKLSEFGLPHAELMIRQSSLGEEMENRLKKQFEDSLAKQLHTEDPKIRISVIQAELEKFRTRVKEYESREQEHKLLKAELDKYRNNVFLSQKLKKELVFAFPNIKDLKITFIARDELKTVEASEEQQTALIRWAKGPTQRERDNLGKFLKERVVNGELQVWEVR